MRMCLLSAVALTLTAGSYSGSTEEAAPLAPEMIIRSVQGASSTAHYAAGRVADELRRLYGLKVLCETEAAAPFADVGEGKGLVVLGERGCSAPFDGWLQERKVPPFTAGGVEAYRWLAFASPLCVAIEGADAVGVLRGACDWLNALRDGERGGLPTTPLGNHEGAPALAIRFTRGIGAPGFEGPVRRVEDALPALDYWARWGMNTLRMPDSGVPPDQREDFTRQFLAEARKRGFRVMGALGVRNLCASDEKAVEETAATFERFLQQGLDGATMLWDDLPHSRCAGHCERCRLRFGPDSMAKEIVHVLERLCDVGARYPDRHPLIIWCPPHYSLGRYPAFSDERFFSVVGASEKVRSTYLFYCDHRPRAVAMLERFGLRHRIWWYNGLRTLYETCHRFPAESWMGITIPGMSRFRVVDLPRFESGWLMGVGVLLNGSVASPSERAWREVLTVPERFEGYYPCTPAHPYHCALSGLFSFSPSTFRQEEADRILFRALFGPGSAPSARRWSDRYGALQVWLARYWKKQPPATERAQAQRLFSEWQEAREAVEALARRGRSLLPPEALQWVLEQMREAESDVARLLKERPDA